MSIKKLTHNVGPERIRPANSYITTNITEAVKLRIENEIPISVPGLFKNTVETYPDHSALAYRDSENQWKKISYREYERKVYQTARAFIKLGLKPRTSVGVIAVNCPEWFYSHLGAIHAGGIISGIYASSTSDGVYHALQTSNATIVVTDDLEQTEKIQAIKQNLPNLKAVIQINGPFDSNLKPEDGYYKWSDIEEMSTDDFKDHLQTRLENIAVNECCAIVYTSGTTGLPKGVMISHDNFTYQCQLMVNFMPNIIFGDETIVSYLPLSNVGPQIYEFFLALTIGATVYFGDRNSLKGSIIETLKQTHPTRMFGVSRIFEKMEEILKSSETKYSKLEQKLLDWAKEVTLNYHLNMIEGRFEQTCESVIADKLILSEIKTKFGLDKLRYVFTGSSPISINTKKFFFSLGVELYDVYGMSETSGAISSSKKGLNKLEAVGKCVEDVELKIFKPNQHGEGEVCIRGRAVFMGYVNELQKTKEVLDEDGWFRTGDLGFIDDLELLHISGRIKELLITSGGLNIPTKYIEHNVKSEIPGISNAFLVGDNKKYLTILLTIKTETNRNTGKPLNLLQNEALDWMISLGLPYKSLDEILNAGPCQKVMKSLQDGIDRANLKAYAKPLKIQKFTILPHDFSEATGELGPTLKVLRNVILEKYKNVIDEMYT